MFNRTLYIFSGQILLAIAIVASTLLITAAFKKVKLGQGTLHVKGCAEREIQSDFVKWRGTLTSTGDTQVSAYEKLVKDVEILLAYMHAEGVDVEKLAFSPIYTTTIYKVNDLGNTKNEVDHYILSQDFAISSPELPLITRVSQNITTLLKEGLTVSSLPPEYYFLKLDEMKISMLGEAAKDARLRADQLVANTSSQVGALRSAQQGVFQITPDFSNSVSDYGEYDTTSIAKRIKAVVTMEYSID